MNYIDILNILLNKYHHLKYDITNYFSPFQFVISITLTARSLDSRVNSILPILFNKYPDMDSIFNADVFDIENILYPIGLYKNKAKNIINLSRLLIIKYNRKIPNSLLELIKLPGIGRKTANIILSHIFKIPGFAVDTHVIKILNRLGIIKIKNTIKIENEVIKNILPKDLSIFSLLLIKHGKICCKSRSPNCIKCCLNDICEYYST